MRALVLIGALGIAALACAQDSTAAGSSWRIGVSGSFDRAFRTLDVSSADQWDDAYVAQRNKGDEPKSTYTLGVDVRYDLGRHWVLASGVQFTDRGYKNVYTDFISVDPIGSDPAIPETLVNTVHFQYFSVPLMAHYRFGKGIVRFEPGVGVLVDRLQSAFTDRELEFADGRVETYVWDPADSRYRSVTLTACAEFNAQLAIAQRWELRLAPRLRYQIITVSDWSVADRLWEAGLLLGCFYRL